MSDENEGPAIAGSDDRLHDAGRPTPQQEDEARSEERSPRPGDLGGHDLGRRRRLTREDGGVAPDELREWYADYLEACNRHDLTAIRAFVAPDVRRAHLPGGADAWIDDLDELFHAVPDVRWKRVSVIVEDDRLAAHLRTSGTERATGRHLNVAEFAMYRITGGRIAEYAGTADPAALLAR